VKEPSEEEMNYAVSVMEGSGIKVKIGGWFLWMKE
jgi:hypothetical protein